MILFVYVESVVRNSCLGALKFMLEAYVLWIRGQWHQGIRQPDAVDLLLHRIHRVWRTISSFDPGLSNLMQAFR